MTLILKLVLFPGQDYLTRTLQHTHNTATNQVTTSCLTIWTVKFDVKRRTLYVTEVHYILVYA